MPPVDRKNPVRAKSSESSYSLMEFMREFKDDDACLEWLWRNRLSEDGKHAHCPKCEQVCAFKRYATKQRRQTWTCTACGQHVQPTAGTIFEGSSTSLHLWFYAIHLMTSTRCGLSAKQLERELGVTYKTAWRMANKIRNGLMTQDTEPLSGKVEIDETWIGGKPRGSRSLSHAEAVRWSHRTKKTVFGMVERQGRIKAKVIPDSRRATLDAAIGDHVLPSTLIFTDEWKPYEIIGRRFAFHQRIPHKAKVYVDGDVYTNTIEGFFGNLKNGLRGTYHAVSHKWLQSYVDEFVWRYNHRGQPMFKQLLVRAATGEIA